MERIFVEGQVRALMEGAYSTVAIKQGVQGDALAPWVLEIRGTFYKEKKNPTRENTVLITEIS